MRGRCLQEVPNTVIWLGNFWYFKKSGRQGEVVATRGFDCIPKFIMKSAGSKEKGNFEHS